MEVHAHTHTPRKKWTHYFWEFLMLFLAVTLGFFVENQREHFIEHQRAKHFAASLYDDLHADTAEILTNRIYIKNLFLAIDSVLVELDKPGDLQNDTILQLSGTRRLLVFDFFDPQMGNYDQIKNKFVFQIKFNFIFFIKFQVKFCSEESSFLGEIHYMTRKFCCFIC